MPEQHRGADVTLADDDVERVVLSLLLESKTDGPWSVSELVLEIGGELRTKDAIRRLCAAGLVHRCEEFLWATRPATRFHQLADAV
jgi:hypothetical protein